MREYCLWQQHCIHAAGMGSRSRTCYLPSITPFVRVGNWANMHLRFVDDDDDDIVVVCKQRVVEELTRHMSSCLVEGGLFAHHVLYGKGSCVGSCCIGTYGVSATLPCN